MGKIWGASKEDWQHLSATCGLTKDLLPVVSNQEAVISPGSLMKAVGKTPSRYNKEHYAVGIPKWTDLTATEEQISRWSLQPDYGICIQTRRIRAFDIDIPDPGEAGKVLAFILNRVGALPMRYRSDSGKCLLAFEMAGDHVKSVIKTAHGAVEFLAQGQQFVAVGTHPAGQPYRWRDGQREGLPHRFPNLTEQQFKTLWSELAKAFAVDGQAAFSRAGRKRQDQLTEAALSDPVVAALTKNNLVLSQNANGSLNITCPFEAEHSTDTVDSSTVYWPAHTGGFAQGHFKCLHAHCAHRGDGDFLGAIAFAADDFDDLDEKDIASSALETDLTETARKRQALAAPGAAQPLPKPSANGHGADGVNGHAGAIEALSLPFKRNKAGEIVATLPNVVKALGSPKLIGAKVYHDTFRDEMMIERAGAAMRPMRDADVVSLREMLERKHRFQPVGRELMRDALRLHADVAAIDTAQMWLDSLKWDGRPRVETFCERYFGVEPSIYARAVSRYIWTALAGRVLDPGCKADMAPVFIGRQGCRKSSGIAAMSPSPDQFYEIRLDDKEDEIARKMRGKLVGELGELKGLSAREVEDVKAWVARRFEEWTPKYQEFATKLPRRILLLGSTNVSDFLVDDTGNRRWLPLTIPDDAWVDVDAIARDRAQLWAEGAVLWLGEGVLWQEAERLALPLHAEHIQVDAVVDEILLWLAAEDFETGKKNRENPFTMLALLQGIGLSARDRNMSAQKRYGRALSSLGYSRQRLRINGMRQYLWSAGQTGADDLC